MRATDIVRKVTDILEKEGTGYYIYSEFKPNPTTVNINQGRRNSRPTSATF